ncbi:MAG: class I SAM-dependent methyltransferase [Clostridia bacterium]|nr:class I SAM-dependent methyltransferase [Clostridia bacterium]
MPFFENTRKPEGFGGKIMLAMMNSGHSAMAQWGLAHIPLAKDATVLDIGCGGGANIRKMLALCPQGHVSGVDYSLVSVEKSRQVNRKAIADGRCDIVEGSALSLPFSGERFDMVTAFETVYFWPEIETCFGEAYRVLAPGGCFMICNESNGETSKDDKWVEMIGGMTIYTGDQLRTFLANAGFTDIHMDKNAKGWLCVTARKK